MRRIKTNSKPVLWLVIVAFLVNTLITQPVRADVAFLPAPGRLVSLTPSFSPPLIRGLKIFKDNPFKFEIVMSQGDSASGQAEGDSPLVKQALLKEEANKLVKYFLAALTVPEKDMWVNLSPYERDRIIPKEFGITEMGKELLAQDYLLKQVTASVMYPEGNVGKEFWRKIYQEAYKRFGTTDIPVNTFNKVWIVPATAVVYENAADNTAVIVESKLKVMLEQDYLSMQKHADVGETRGQDHNINALGSQIVREIIIPQLTKEVNEGKNFAVLRQVYQSLILAFWYKNKLKQSLISQGYVDRKKTSGVDVEDKNIDQEIYRQYLKSYKKGVYNYIKEEMTPTNEMIPRKYFSGGVAWGNIGEIEQIVSGPDSAQLAARMLKPLKIFVLTVGLAAAFLAINPSTALGQQSSAPAILAALAQTSPIVSATVKPNDSVSKIFTHKIMVQIRDSLDPSHKLKIEDLIASGRISIFKDGKKIERSNLGIIHEGEEVRFDLTGYIKPGITVGAAQLLPPPIIQQSLHSEGAKIIQRYAVNHPAAHVLNVTASGSNPDSVTFKVGSIELRYGGISELVKLGVVQIDGKTVTNSRQIFSNVERPVTLDLDAVRNTGTGAGTAVVTAAGSPPPPPAIVAAVHLPSAQLKPTKGQVQFHNLMRGFIKNGGPLAGPQPVMTLDVVGTVPNLTAPLVTSLPTTVGGELGDTQRQLGEVQANIEKDLKAKAAYIAEQQRLRALIANKPQQGTLAEIRTQERALIEDYHLSVPTLAPVPLPYQTPGMAPPIVTFRPNAVGIAYIDYQINQINKQASTAIKGTSPVNGFVTPYYNRPYVSAQLGGGATTFSILPDLPFRNLLTLSQIAQGLPQFGSQAVFSQVAGPLFGAQILADLRNYVVMHPTRGQDVRYDARMKDPVSGLIQTVTVHVTPVKSFDQEGHEVNEYLYSVGLVDTVQALLGKLDGALGNQGIIGDSSKHFVAEDLGYQISVNDYQKAFTQAASFNTDSNVTYIKVYNIDNPKIRHRKNASNGWDVIDPSTPFNSRLDFYSATVNGFILRLDPATGKATGQRVLTAPTFVTGAFTRTLTGQQGFFMERILSVEDLKRERMLLTGVNEKGQIIWGVLRHPVTGRIIKFITDPSDLNAVSWLTNNKGNSVRFVPGQAYQAPSGLANVGNILRDYTVDEFSRVFDKLKGVVRTTTVADKYNGYDLSGRPQLTEIPLGLNGLFSGKGLMLDSSPALKAVYEKAKDHYGVIFFVDGRIPAVLTNMEHVRTLESLDESNGVTKLPDGLYVLKGFNKHLAGNTLVLLNDRGIAIGYIDPSDKLRQERINDLEKENQQITLRMRGLENYGFAIASNSVRALMTPAEAEQFIPAKFAGDGVVGQRFGVKKPVVITGDMLVRVENINGRNTVVEILESGKKIIVDRQVVLSTLAAGGVEAEDQRGERDQITGLYKNIIFAKGNDLTPQQKALKIHSGKELVDLVLTGQAIYVPIEGTVIILKEAPPLRLRLERGGFNERGLPRTLVASLFNPTTTAGAVLPASFYNPALTVAQAENVSPAPVISAPLPLADVRVETLSGPDGKAFHGVTIDTEVFRPEDIAKLNNLGATAVRTYYPIPIEIAQQLVAQSKVKTIIVGIPLDANAYIQGNLTNFWGRPLPAAGERLSLEDNNYVPYLKQLVAALGGKVKIVVDLGNELNFKDNYPLWKGKPDNPATYTELFDEINGHARIIKDSLGASVTTSFTLGDRPEHFALALKTAPAIDAWGINLYRHDLSLADDMAKALKETGVHRPFYIAEAGVHSDVGVKAQAEVDRNDWEEAEIIGQSIIFNSLADNPRKKGDHETAWGLFDQFGNPKPVLNELTRSWGEIIAGTPGDVSINTMADVNKYYALVRFFSDDRSPTIEQEVRKPLHTERVLASDLDKLAPVLGETAVEILQVNAKGETTGRYVKMFGGGYKLWKVADLEENMKHYFMIVRKDGKGAEFVSLNLLKFPQIHEAVRQMADEITMMDTNQQVTVRVYLNKNINGSRVEVLQGNNTSLIFELPSFFPSNLANPVARTTSSTDPQGLLHVITTDLREANPGVVIEDVYQPVPNAKPIKLYSDRFLQKERIYFKDGHEQYSISLDTTFEPGQTVVIDGRSIGNVTGLFKYDKITDSGYHVSLRNIERIGWFAPIRFTQFEDGQIKVDQTGFVKLERGLNDQQIMDRVKGLGVLNMKDVYTYKAYGQLDNRVVSFMSDGKWQEAWTLKGGYIGPQGAMMDHLTNNEIIAQAFLKYKMNSTTILTETIREVTDGVVTKDYRITGDVLEKKMFSVIEQDGVVIKIIVGLDFDPRTGEQVLSYQLTPDFKVQSLFRTMPNELSFKQLLPQGTAAEYSQFMKEHFNISNADLLQDLEKAGVSPDFKPVRVQEIPFIIQTDNPNDQGYKYLELKIRPLLKAYMAEGADRPGILEQISDLVRHYHRDNNTAHYTQLQGQSSEHYLAPPNDTRGKDFIKTTGNGDIGLDLWWLAGTRGIQINTLPGSIVFDNSGKLKRTMMFARHEDRVFKDAKDQPQKLGVNVYTVSDDPRLNELVFITLGPRVSETFPYVRNRVVNGQLGVQTRGAETITYDPMSPYALPVYGTLDEDGRLTKVILHLEYTGDEQGQKIFDTSIVNEPTAPGSFHVKRQLIRNGEPVPGTLKELDVWTTYWNDFKDNLVSFIAYPIMLFSSFFTGAFLRKKRFENIKKGLSQRLSKTESEEVTVPEASVTDQRAENPIEPSWNAYGYSRAVVDLAREKWEGTVLPALKYESMDDVLKEHFNGYQVWRKEIMGIDGPFTPTKEDLWVMFLIDKDSNIFNTGMPDGLNYLVHKAIEETRKNSNANVGGFVKKTYTLFHDILEEQHTTFQGRLGGNMKNVVPADYYVNTDDFEDWFRTKGFIDWFDGLGYTFDGEEDFRSALYKDFTKQLKKEADAVKEALLNLSPKMDNDVLSMKRRAVTEDAYKGYVNFFNSIKDGKFTPSEQFSFPGISRQEAMQRINGKPMIYKTFAESPLPAGRVPFVIRVLKPAAQLLRNSYKQLRNNIFLTSATGLAVLTYNGYMTPGWAAISAAIGMGAAELAYRFLNLWLDRDLNLKGHGKPKPFWAGYNMAESTTGQKWYQWIFWTSVISLKIVWDAYMLDKFFIPHFETIGADYFPFGSPINLNLLLMFQQWTVGAMFLFVFAWASNYLVITPMTHIYNAMKGVGTIKTAKDIRALVGEKLLGPLMIEKLLPQRAQGLRTDEQRSNAVKEFIGQDFDSHRSRDDASDNEGVLIKEGQIGGYKSPAVEYRKTKSVNSLVMNSPSMPNFDDITPFGLGIPVYAEDLAPPFRDIKEGRVFEKSKITGLWDGERILRELVGQDVLEDVSGTQVKIKADLDSKKDTVRSIAGDNFEYLWEKILQDRNIPTALDVMVNSGYTNLNWIISRSPERWENLIERLRRGTVASEEELKRMQELLTKKGKIKSGKLGEVNKDLEMEIRLWAAYASQPFARTLDGVMNIVRALQFYCKLAHPDWSKEKIQRETNKKFQLIWAYQIWGDILKATPDHPDLLLKKEDTEFLVKKYYDELGFIIDISSLEVRNGISHKVLYRYDPQAGKIKEVYAIGETKNMSIVGEGKAYNQEKAFSFGRNGVLGLWDMNMDLDFWEAANIIKLQEEFKDKKVGLVNFPELIASSGFSLTATSLADSDENFAGVVKGHMAQTHSPMHHGHPDFVRVSASREAGGFSSGLHVTEDYPAGLKLFWKGFKMIQVQYVKAMKFREYSWFGSLGQFTKFAMGSAKKLLSRYADWNNKRLGIIKGAAEFYTGPAFYLLQTIATLGFFQYLFSVMVLGISPFTALTTPVTTMFVGVFIVGQSLTWGGWSKMVLEDGFWKGSWRFWVKSLYFIAPFFIAHMFSYQAGFLSGLVGMAAYIATGRGYFREHVEIDKMFSIARSHTIVGLAGLGISAYAYSIWQNSTFLFSFPTIIAFLFPLVVPFLVNPGTFPVNGVTWKTAADRYKTDLKLGSKKITQTIYDGWFQKVLKREQVEKAGLDWEEVSGKLIGTGLASKINDSEIILKTSLKRAEERLQPDDPDLSNILSLLKKSVLRDYSKVFIDSIVYSITYGAWLTITLPVGVYTGITTPFKKRNATEVSPVDTAMTIINSDKALIAKAPGGINLGRTVVRVENSGDLIQTAFDDPAMLRLLLNSDGLTPIIYDIKIMTPSMVDHYVGLN